MTPALRELVQAHDRDQDFPYMDFVGAFLRLEGFVQRQRGRTRQMLLEAEPADLLGVPLGTEADDLKLGYVLHLLKQHGLQLLEQRASSGPMLH